MPARNRDRLDVEGPGILYFARYNHWHGSPWHYVVDGADHIVQETSSADPTKPVAGSVFMPEHLFPNPLTWTWDITKGAEVLLRKSGADPQMNGLEEMSWMDTKLFTSQICLH